MAWNEPGKGDKDPWGNRNDRNSPPDLDDVLKKMQAKLGGLFGGNQYQNDNNNSALGIILLIIFAIWLLSGIYIVDPAERGVVTRFGAFQTVAEPGPHWHIPYPIEGVQIVNVEQSRNTEIGYRSSAGRVGSSRSSEALMLTRDENIVELRMEVQYKINDAAYYLFNVKTPDLTLRQLTESAVRETVGQSEMDFVLTEGRSEVASRTELLLQSKLDELKTGLEVTSVNIGNIQPPEQVQAAFSDVVKAREDRERAINQAEAYANDILPKARGAAFRLIQEAEAYKKQVIAQSEGDASRFSQVMNEYKKAPKITSERLYIESMESIYSQSAKVMVDVKEGGNNMLYLPLDKMRQQAQYPRVTTLGTEGMNTPYTSSMTNSSSTTGDARSRGGR